MKKKIKFAATLIGISNWICVASFGWDYEGHRVVNQLALSALPESFPAFVRTPANAERIAFLAGEPDRWRNSPDLPLQHINEPDHYLDVEELSVYGLTPESLPVFRGDFIAQLALIRQARPTNFPAPAPSHDKARTRQLVGLLPWAMAENYGKLKSGFSYLKAFEQAGGTPDEIANAQANIVYIMGVMGHYVGDAAQPLHTTIHHHGWVGDNPHNYSTNYSFHSWIDGGFFRKVHGADVNGMKGKMRPAHVPAFKEHPAAPEEMFQACVTFILEQRKMLEPLYQLEKEGKLSGEGTEGKAFLEGQLVKGSQMLADIWYAAWEQAPVDRYLQEQLAKRHTPPSATGK